MDLKQLQGFYKDFGKINIPAYQKIGHMRKLLPKIGSWSFICGVVIAIFTGVFTLTPAIVGVLILLGVVVGLLNIRGKEAMTFLLAAVSLVVISSLGTPAFAGIPVLGVYLQRMLNNLIIFTIPAAMIVALRAILTIAYKK